MSNWRNDLDTLRNTVDHFAGPSVEAICDRLTVELEDAEQVRMECDQLRKELELMEQIVGSALVLVAKLLERGGDRD